MVHTCPRCELRFVTDAELTDHLKVDHHLDVAGFERFTYRPLDQRPTTRRFLVVGNQTLADDSLIDRVCELANGGHVHLVVPATPSHSGEQIDDKGLALATFRMRRAIDKLHDAGLDAEGEVGVADPIHAVTRALDHEAADEIILSTLPAGTSKWLDINLPKALEHRFGLPVTVLSATP